MKKIAILGSTGSIGTQTLEVARNNGDLEITALAAGSNIDLLERQIREFLSFPCRVRRVIHYPGKVPGWHIPLYQSVPSALWSADQHSCEGGAYQSPASVPT